MRVLSAVVGCGLFFCTAWAVAAGTNRSRPANLGGNEPPANPFLADSVWPMSHRHPYNQGSSPFPGPTSRVEAQPDFLAGEAVAITLAVSGLYPDGRRVTWGTTLKHVFKMDANGRQLGYIDRLPRSQTRADAISGAYSLVDRDGTYFVPRGPSIETYRDRQRGQVESPIEAARSFEIPQSLRSVADDSIVGISMTFDGRIVFVTRYGLVGSLSRELDDFLYLRLGDGQEDISNSLAVDEQGGLFIVTSRTVNKVQWDREAPRPLRLAWSAPYRTSNIRPHGRLGKGSGTTPSLIGSGSQDKFVAICDGQTLMHIVLFWRNQIPEDWDGLPGKDRRIAAEVPVRFGDPEMKRSTTEQSLTVRGYDLVVVSNLYGKLTPLLRRFVRRRMGNDIHSATIYRSNVPEVAPHGVEKFSWDPSSRELRLAWSNREMSCPNGVPTMSEATGLLYFMGQRGGHWTLEGVSWETGKSVFHQTLARASKHNSFYAATEIGPQQCIMTGTFGGVLRFGGKPTEAGKVSTSFIRPVISTQPKPW